MKISSSSGIYKIMYIMKTVAYNTLERDNQKVLKIGMNNSSSFEISACLF